ncbi:glycosyltransferase family 2 protein [Sphingobium bisphenolivorans]|uniref:glycosyltransferase family 2 protein n=1 Tax=Sphingobium bisphenolivorans TaxID=1335760 RepID=UPI00039A9DCB|nr:glycosyltransferase family 2 protein [Sphingobium bisphenolivorans]
MTAALLWIVAIAVSLPLLAVSVECLAALVCRPPAAPRCEAPPLAVLMPAHDEAQCIGPTIEAVRAQLRAQDRLLVVADNCSDATAAIARMLGAEVIERQDVSRRGKGFALAFGRDHLRDDPPGVVLVLDADTLPASGAIHGLAAAAIERKAALQGLYLIEGSASDPRVAVSTLAFRLKNLVRQRGLQALSGNALLQGSGMAFPWAMFSAAPLATASLVEDLQLGVDLFLRGGAVGFAEHACFTSGTSGVGGTISQRTRWEHGSMAAAPRLAGRMLAAAVRGRAAAWPLALNLVVPPLGMLALLCAIALLVLGGSAVAGPGAWPLAMLTASLALFCTTLLLVWHRWGRDLLPVSALHQLAVYLFWKMPVSARFLFRRQSEWVRTDRERSK